MVRAALLVIVLLLGACGGERGEVVTVFAAASLTDAVEALADSFAAAHPAAPVRVNVAASSLLARQIERGAPADVFFSASTEWMDHLVARGRVAGPVHYPLSNRLVVAGREGAPLLPSLDALAGLERVALADPEAVPAGVYARAGLECAGVWEAVAPRVVPALDVRAALLAVQGGASDAAIVYASDVRVARGVRVLLAWPPVAHPPIRYALAAVGTPSARARAFVRYAASPERAALWRAYGFLPLPASAGGTDADGCTP